MTCPHCGTENPPSQKFCGECGAPLQATCGSCRAPNPPGQRFCGECGTALTAAATATAPPPTAGPAAERRLVSVLFADLVGFTATSEGRDAEDTRELLTRYFEQARTTIERYGGTVEKFIGDAVMAVWGAPVAQPLLDEAREHFEHMGATYWLDRLDALAATGSGEPVPA